MNLRNYRINCCTYYLNSGSLFYAYHIDLESSKLNDNILIKFLKLFPESSYNSHILWKLAQSTYYQGKLNESKKYFNKLSSEYKNSELGQKADKRLIFWPDALIFIPPTKEIIDLGLPPHSKGDILIFENYGNSEVYCVLRRKPATHSGESCRPFRLKTATYSGRNLPFRAF